MSVMRNIPFFNYAQLFESQETEIMAVMRDVMKRGAFILQKDLLEFETALREFLSVKHAFGVADGTNALLLALRAAGIRDGDEVIVPAHTYVASAAAIHYAGARPVLVECGSDHMMDPNSAEQAITSRTRAIMPVQLNGRTCRMDQILEVADSRGLIVVEDAAQALGSRFQGQCAGTFGQSGTFSFYPAKLLGCFGDGGAVITNDDTVAEQISLLRDHGRDPDGEVVAWGTNSRLDNLHAAVLHFKLKAFVDDIARRRAIAKRYDEGLNDVDALHLPPAPTENGDNFDVYQNYEIEADRRDELKRHLEARGVRTIVQFGGKALHQFEALGMQGVSLPATERLYERALLLPMNTTITDDDVDFIIDSITDFYGASRL